MSIERTEVEKIAQLAKLSISEQESATTADELSNILEFVDQLQAIDTSGVEPMAHPLDAHQRLRADIITEENQREKFQAIAPQAESGLYLVPKVIDQ